MEGQRSTTLGALLPSFLKSPLKHLNQRRRAEDVDGQLDPDAAKSSYARRRAQVKRAQSKHRARKQNYIMALEEEARYLQDAIALQAELKDVEAENRILKELIAANGLALPNSPGFRDRHPAYRHRPIASSPGEVARVALVGSPGSHQYLQLQTPKSTDSLTRTQGFDDETDLLTIPQRGDVSSNAAKLPAEAGDVVTDSTTHDYMFGQNMDTDIAGFDFVLTLERPCLDHILHPPDSVGASGHALTLNATTLACAPSNLQPQEPWSVPIGTLERLLELSTALGLGLEELTPVQAWDRIRKHPKFSSLTQSRLQALVSRLSKEVQCYGFGAVMDETAFSILLEEA